MIRNREELKEFYDDWKKYNYEKVEELHSNNIVDSKIYFVVKMGIIYMLDFVEEILFVKFGGRDK